MNELNGENQKSEGEPSWKEIRPQLLKFVLELGPLVIFFLANARGKRWIENYEIFSNFDEPIFLATALFMAAMVLSLVLSKLYFKRLPVMPLVTGFVVLIFGGLTLYLKDDTFIKMKPTIVNILFGGVLLGGLAFGVSLLKYVFGEVYRLQSEGWKILTVRWGLFFLFLAIVNELVWRNFSTDAWVSFKVWGIMPITIIFSFFQISIINRFALKDGDDQKN